MEEGGVDIQMRQKRGRGRETAGETWPKKGRERPRKGVGTPGVGWEQEQPTLPVQSPSARSPQVPVLCPQMLLHLFSDANYNLLGFNASFRFSLCPGGCGSHGQCRAPGVCACEPGWGGPDCSLQECPAYCGSHGTCASVSLSPAVVPPPPRDPDL